MPPSHEILEGLARIARVAWPLAALWHAIVAGVIALVVGGAWRPTQRRAALCATGPLASVSILAWLGGNPFNGAVFAIAALALAGVSLRMRPAPLRAGPSWAIALGALSVAFAWVYPHFLETLPAYFYVFAAPMGVVPCPTLALVLGVGLMAGAFGSRAWAWTAGALGIVYAVVGVARFGVWIDGALLVASIATIAAGFSLPRGGKRSFDGSPIDARPTLS